MVAWVALVLAVLELVLLVAVVGGGVLAYRRLRPTLSPFLAMLGPYTSTSNDAAGSSSTRITEPVTPADPPPLSPPAP